MVWFPPAGRKIPFICGSCPPPLRSLSRSRSRRDLSNSLPSVLRGLSLPPSVSAAYLSVGLLGLPATLPPSCCCSDTDSCWVCARAHPYVIVRDCTCKYCRVYMFVCISLCLYACVRVHMYICSCERREAKPSKIMVIWKTTQKNNTSKPIVNAGKINIPGVRAWESAMRNRECRWVKEYFATGFCKKSYHEVKRQGL